MNPDQLLQQIQDLLQQYLQLGPDTPVAAEAQQLSDAIDQTAGSSGPAAPPGPESEGPGESPVDTEGASDQDAMDLMAPQPGEPPANAGHKTFDQANVSALERLRKRNQSKA
jgi:hypothetical protein